MGLNFRKSVTICKGVKLNLGKSSASVSLGTRGAHVNLSSTGRKSATVGLPGTGLSYTKTLGSGKKSSSKSSGYGKSGSKSSSSSGKALSKEQEKAIAAASAEVEEFESYLDAIRSVHKECEEEVDWEAMANEKEPLLISEAWKERHELAERILSGDIDAYYDVISANDPFTELAEYGSDFEFGTDDPDRVEVEFTVKSDEVVPKQAVSATKTGVVSEKDLSKTAYYDYVQDYVCSCTIRLAREIFAILPVQFVTVHAVDTVLNTATGRDEETTILSVLFNRRGFMDINFDRIDASDFVSSFDHNMIFGKTTGFKAVERI